MPKSPTNRDLQGQINGISISIVELKDIANENRADISDIKGNLKGYIGAITERCISHDKQREASDKRIGAVESAREEDRRWTLGALFAGFLSLLGLIASFLLGK